ncbi:metalloregulator ArsR/SmtB family transcription factor [uncultured Roseobacter sp.]|uniref:ArsR/SmtB family transcription factor n=1 Tax=uncultured Roseobacter sp. TaxID=114847 RepID=UPI002630EBD4|nr:metalloregulator ArsR/SmtB family transcription factor [uncultured Roseobacter sp.]
MDESDKLDAVFSALAHPTRRAILAQLVKGTATVNDLAEPFDMSLPAISKHIRVLEDAGLITRGKDAQFRPCTIDTRPLQDIARWTDQYRHIWEARFDVMETLLNDTKGTQS